LLSDLRTGTTGSGFAAPACSSSLPRVANLPAIEPIKLGRSAGRTWLCATYAETISAVISANFERSSSSVTLVTPYKSKLVVKYAKRQILQLQCGATRPSDR
jgi:hypothetical protein